MTAQSSPIIQRLTCPACLGVGEAKERFALPCFFCSGQGLVDPAHYRAIHDGARLQRWVRVTGLPIHHFARAFKLPSSVLVDVMYGRTEMSAELARGLAFFEKHGPSTIARHIMTDSAISVGARAMYEGPLGADDEADFDTPKAQKASDWCRSMFTAALEAVAIAPISEEQENG